ncbi:photosystem I protein [Cylindrospermopsis raciborskii LB2897]|nr:photosystem I protein [Cylindrospermopsis raciborskii LB2897]
MNIFKDSGNLVLLFGICGNVIKSGGSNMTSKTKETKPSYVFRASWAILLLAINFLVAAYYFHIVE